MGKHCNIINVKIASEIYRIHVPVPFDDVQHTLCMKLTFNSGGFLDGKNHFQLFQSLNLNEISTHDFYAGNNEHTNEGDKREQQTT